MKLNKVGDKMKKYKIEKSIFPEGKNTHLVVMYSTSEHGYNYQRVFKGSREECKIKKEELENESKYAKSCK